MVTKPNMPVPPAPTGLQKGRKMEPPKLATAAPYSPKYQADPDSPSKDIANKDRGATFKMPDKVPAKEVRDESFRYGGSRSSGNRSLEENRKMQEKQP